MALEAVENSTGPKTEDGKLKSSRNAYKGGRRPALRAAVKRLRSYIVAVRDILD